MNIQMQEVASSTVCLLSDGCTDTNNKWNNTGNVCLLSDGCTETNNEWNNTEHEYDSDDSSSGYNTSRDFDTSVSDSDSDWDGESELESINVLGFEDVAESTIFQNASSLCHTFEYILCVPEMCDVTFLVGKEKIPVYGLKSVIGARSSVLCDMILSHQRKSTADKMTSQRSNKVLKFLRLGKQKKTPKTKPGHMNTTTKLVITVSHFDYNVFRKLVFFLHLGHVTVTQDTLIGLLCAASEFKILDLSRACWEFLNRSLSFGHMTEMVKSAKKYKEHPSYESIIEKIMGSKNTEV